jgi:hypothetical protein
VEKACGTKQTPHNFASGNETTNALIRERHPKSHEDPDDLCDNQVSPPLFSASGRKTTIKNRAIMGSMHTGLEEQEDGHIRMAEFFAERARGGIGLIHYRRHFPE